MFVLYGERPRGGGNVVFDDLRIRRVDKTSVGSGTEPDGVVSTVYAVKNHELSHVLCARSILDELSVVFPFWRLGEPFSGDEKIPSRSSMPCSSFWPTGSVIPVFLADISAMRLCKSVSVGKLTVPGRLLRRTGCHGRASYVLGYWRVPLLSKL